MYSTAPFNGALSALRPVCIPIATQHSYSSPSQRHKHFPSSARPAGSEPRGSLSSRTLYLVFVQCTSVDCCWQQDTAQRVPVKFVNYQLTKARRAGIAVVRRNETAAKTHRDVHVHIRTPDQRKLEYMNETAYTRKQDSEQRTERRVYDKLLWEVRTPTSPGSVRYSQPALIHGRDHRKAQGTKLISSMHASAALQLACSPGGRPQGGGQGAFMSSHHLSQEREPQGLGQAR